jgi:hypothetical protein
MFMNRLFVLAAIFALITAPAFASTKSESVNIAEPVTFGSSHLAPGHYKVTWDGTGPIVHVTLASGKTSATADAKLVNSENSQTGVVFTDEGSAKVLNEIDLRHVSLLLRKADTAEN